MKITMVQLSKVFTVYYGYPSTDILVPGATINHSNPPTTD